MAIKSVNFSFNVPIEQLLMLVASGNVAMKVDVYGNDKVAKGLKALNGHPAPKLLEGPKAKNPNKTGNGARAILEFLVAHPEHKATSAELRALTDPLGLHKNTAATMMSAYKRKGFIKTAGEGVFQLTAAGIKECARRGVEISAK